MRKRNFLGIFDINAPVILGLTMISLFLLAANALTNGAANRFFGVHFTSWLSPLMYLRLFTHTLVHADFSHYIGNFLLLLTVGPLVEEKYGSHKLIVMFLVTSAVTGLITVIFFRNIMLLGASGLVFMLILLSSFTNLRGGKIPVTVVLVAVLYIGREVAGGLFLTDNISQLSHIVGGLCGAAFGVIYNKNKLLRGG